MNNFYDLIKADHTNILLKLKKLTVLFGEIPLHIIHADEPPSPTPEPLSENQDTSKANDCGYTIKYDWKKKEEALKLTTEFYDLLKKHFEFEKAVVFCGICTVAKSPKITDWVLERITEHGEILGITHSLLIIIELIEVPIKHKAYDTLKENFENLHNTIMSHALEEDTKLSKYLTQNQDIAVAVKKLKEKYTGKS